MVYAYPKCKNIVVDDYSKAYRDEVVRYLDLIATTDVGRILYDFMGKTTKTVRITWTLGTSWTETGVTTFTDADLRRVLEAAERISRLRRIPIEDAIDAAMRKDVALSAKTKGRYAKDHPVMQRLRIDIFAALGLHSTFQVPTTDIGTGEEANHILEAHLRAVEQVFVLPVAIYDAFDDDFFKI